MIPQARPTMAAIGIEVAGWPRETPPTKMTASIPSRKTVIKGSTKSTHLPLFAPASTSVRRKRRIVRRNTKRGVGEMRRTLTGEGFLELDAPFSLGAIHLEHGDTHDEDHNARDQLEYACERDLAMSTANDRHKPEKMAHLPRAPRTLPRDQQPW